MRRLTPLLLLVPTIAVIASASAATPPRSEPRAASAPTAPAPRHSFKNDVIPVLARLGCSAGSCHGANSGKGSFKLSLRGYAPELDHVAITRQYGGRRISRVEPERSLLLRKPLAEVRHGGGRVLRRGTPEFAVIAGWLRDGAPGLTGTEPRLVGLVARPGDRVYRPKERQRLTIHARFSDGHVEDVTPRVLFRSNDLAVAEVDEHGVITARNPGATAVQAKYMDGLAVVRVTVPYPGADHREPDPRRLVSTIDAAVAARLRELNLDQSGPCTDAEFLRRVTIDALGTLPTAAEARAFLDDRRPDKRDRWIDAVLQRPEFASVWALKLADLFLMRKEHMGRKNTFALHQWLTEQFIRNRPWDRIATDLIAASGSTREKPQTLWYVSRQQSRPNARGWIRSPELTAEVVAQVFLGTRIQCARCHNHPTERYTQDDYYHLAAIFGRVNGDGGNDIVPERLIATAPSELRHPRTGEHVEPRPLDRRRLNVGTEEDARVRFADWLRGPGREPFARNIANRVWARLFGTGVVEPVDDMRATNPPRNQALMDALTRELIANGYDLKRLMATIMRSRTYQTSATPTPRNRIDRQFFSHYPVRRLPAEELVDALAQVTGVPDKFATYPLGTRAIELSDIELPSLALDTFGRPPRVMPNDSERCNVPSVSQALDLINGESLQAKLKDPEGNLASLLKSDRTDAQLIEELFLMTFARRPSPEEAADTRRVLLRTPSREEGMQDVLWALVNSKEFMFQH